MYGVKSALSKLKVSYFFYSILCICLGYIAFEFFFISYWALAADEFVFARQIYDYTINIPYRDFPPYKAVLGYYLLSIPMFFSHTLLAPLFYIKKEIALINMAFIALASFWASRLFDKRAVLLTLLAILANQLFLIYASDLRVDMLTSWFCLFAALAALENRPKLGGVCIAIAFLISQKALWYLFAINGAMIICWMVFSSPVYSVRSIITFNSMALFCIILYIAGWSFTASPSDILHSLFYEAYIQAGIQWYEPIYLICWKIVLMHGPILILLWPFTFLSLIDGLHDKAAQKRLFVISLATIALLLFVNYKQPFPYNFVFTMPALFLLYSDFISWLLQKKVHAIDAKPLSTIFILVIFLYTLSLFFYINMLELPVINNLIALLPIMTCLYLYSPPKTSAVKCMMPLALSMVFILVGIISPLYITWKNSVALNGDYQQTMIQTAAKLMEPNGDYIGGIPFIYQKDQPIDGMKNLIGPAISYLYDPNPKIEPLLLPSLYLSTTTAEKVLEEFEKTPVKVIFDNYRMLTLPPKLRRYITANYSHFYGSLYLYAPTIKSTQLSFFLKFSATYRVEMKTKKIIRIDGKRIHHDQLVHLKKGDHVSDANQDYQLVLIPDNVKQPINPNYKEDEWYRMIKAILS